MKICFFTENYYKGGLDTFIVNLINEWPNSSDELTLICNGSHPGLQTITDEISRPLEIISYFRFYTSKIANGQSSLKFTRSIPVKAFFVLSFWVLKYPILFPWYLLSLAWFFHKNKFDRLMVINGGYPASILGQCALISWKISGRRPLATFNFHNSTANPPLYLRFVERVIDRAVINSSSKIVSVSKACLDTLYTRKAFINCEKLQYIHNGIVDPTLIYRKIDESAEKEQHSNNKYCIMLATYEARKGHFYLLSAFRMVLEEFPNMQLRIYGFGKPKEIEKVRTLVSCLSLEKNVSINEFTLQKIPLIANASLLVMPSQEYESFGLTIIEAMALGTPVVTTNVGGMPEVLKDSNAGFVCSKDDPKEFANAIKLILRDSDLAYEMSQNGIQTFQNKYTATKMAQQYEILIKNK